MKWHITFFNKKVRSQALAFPAGILANFLHLIRLVEKFGPQRKIELARKRMKEVMK
jgi:hypothetical protein